MNRAIIAVAGAGKTEELSTSICSEPNPKRVLVLTYTERNQREIAARIAQKSTGAKKAPDTMGWMAFLLNQIIRPYLPALYPNVQLRGLGKDPANLNRLSGARRYFNRHGDAYPGFLAKLAVDITTQTKKAPIKRLEKIYDSIYIDEAQDLCANDLVIIEKLLKSKIQVTLMLDPRQSVLQTTERDSKYKSYRRIGISLFFRELEQKGVCCIEERLETHRFIPSIAALSDAIIPAVFGFAKTISRVPEDARHSGVFILSKANASSYVHEHSATVLRISVRAGSIEGAEVANFGECKGMSRDHVLVLATKPIEKALMGQKELEGKSLCGFYVAITRARYSVAIAVDNPEKVIAYMKTPGSRFAHINIQKWVPNSSD